MLQPVQLREVALRHAAEIGELRGFLTKAGIAVGSAQTLSQLASRLQHDRDFHRDLLLHVWVLIDRCGGGVSHSELLGVLAVAAAGEQVATHATERDAQHLLRFIMEALRSMDVPSTTGRAESIPYQPIQRQEEAAVPRVRVEAVRPELESAAEHVTPDAMKSTRSDTAEKTSSNRYAWGVALALFLLAAVSIVVWRYEANSSTQGRNPAPIISSPDAGGGTSVLPESAAGSASTASASPGGRSRTLPPEPQAAPNANRERSFWPKRETAPATASAAPHGVPGNASTARAESAVPAPILRAPAAGSSTLPATGNSGAGTSAPVVARPGATRPAVPVPVPTSNLSRQLGSSSIPAYSALPDQDATTDSRKYPRLLRRRTSSGGNNNLVADLRTPGSPNASAMNSAVVPVGVVRPTSLGIMAGNLLYSPTPSYPAAAAAAHVQGEVKVQAEIDRDGNVVSARVVSGPPMLRDAAVDAIQHWRYKPWTAGGKSVATSALAVIDFQLP